MKILGIESTAHTFGVSIVDNKRKGMKKILSNEKDTYTTKEGGIIPMKAAEHHQELKEELYNSALKKAKIKENEIELIAFSQSPGLAPCLRVGRDFATKLSKKLKLPLIGVNHCIAHLEIGKLAANVKDPVFLFISGANTQVISYASNKYRIFGETLDMGLGNFIDTFARELNLGFPGGPKISKLAEKGKDLIELPYSVKGMDVSFSGLLTNLKQKLSKKEYTKENLCYSMQEHVFAMVLEVAERAMAHLKKKELIAIGGVASNKRFREMAEIMTKERGGKFFSPPLEVVMDNAAMIAYTGGIMYNSDKKYILKGKVEFLPHQRTDEVEVRWIKKDFSD